MSAVVAGSLCMLSTKTTIDLYLYPEANSLDLMEVELTCEAAVAVVAATATIPASSKASQRMAAPASNRLDDDSRAPALAHFAFSLRVKTAWAYPPDV